MDDDGSPRSRGKSERDRPNPSEEGKNSTGKY